MSSMLVCFVSVLLLVLHCANGQSCYEFSSESECQTPGDAIAYNCEYNAWNEQCMCQVAKGLNVIYLIDISKNAMSDLNDYKSVAEFASSVSQNTMRKNNAIISVVLFDENVYDLPITSDPITKVGYFKALDRTDSSDLNSALDHVYGEVSKNIVFDNTNGAAIVVITGQPESVDFDCEDSDDVDIVTVQYTLDDQDTQNLSCLVNNSDYLNVIDFLDLGSIESKISSDLCSIAQDQFDSRCEQCSSVYEPVCCGGLEFDNECRAACNSDDDDCTIGVCSETTPLPTSTEATETTTQIPDVTETTKSTETTELTDSTKATESTAETTELTESTKVTETTKVTRATETTAETTELTEATKSTKATKATGATELTETTANTENTGSVNTAETRSYVYVIEELSIEDARDYCTDTYGTDLATITSADELSEAVTVIGSESRPWIGLYREDSDSDFEFYDGTSCTNTEESIYCVSSDLWEGPPNEGKATDCTKVSSEEIDNSVACNKLSPFLCNAGTSSSAAAALVRNKPNSLKQLKTRINDKQQHGKDNGNYQPNNDLYNPKSNKNPLFNFGFGDLNSHQVQGIVVFSLLIAYFIFFVGIVYCCCYNKKKYDFKKRFEAKGNNKAYEKSMVGVIDCDDETESEKSDY